MIVVKLLGGLGNQMFQYAVGRQLAHVMKADLKLDISSFKYSKLRTYALGIFNIIENFATSQEVASLTVCNRGVINRLIDKLFHKPPELLPTYIKQKHNHFDPGILKLPDNVYLEGYWQSERYFKDINEIIRKEFTIKYSQTGENEILSRTIGSCNSVSIHIRRGDYVHNPVINDMHGVCEVNYYQRCIDLISKKVTNPYFFIFSDDPEWVKHNFKINYKSIVIEHNRLERYYEDLRLLSQCKHHIIANSTFSWWGAWLSENPEKIVIAPKKWFKREDRNREDLIPEGWIRI